MSLGQETFMDLTILLPTETLFRGQVAKLSARAKNGMFGVLPNHIDFVTALAPGILAATTPAGQSLYFGMDEGVFVKQEHDVRICVRHAVQGTDLARLSDTVHEAFIEIDDRERSARAALARLEADVVRRFAELKDIRE